jgi:4-alpha-glucanotransferase
VVRAGAHVELDGAWEIELESGERRSGKGALRPDLPLGYHHLSHGSQTVRLIVSPGRCHLPEARKWGWAVQLYALRSRASWGMGDLGDLTRLGDWAAGKGAGMVMVNPLHATRPGGEASPYFPSSRCWYDPTYLDMSQAPGIGACPDLPRLRAEADRLNAEPLIDRTRVWTLKRAGLEWAWEQFRGDPNFEEYARCSAPSLSTYARFAALSEIHEGPWPTWREAAPAPPERVRFHMWLQWLLDCQLADAGRSVDLVTDLAVGVDPAGADTWMWPDCFALGARVGAPPDAYNPQGQDWGLPPLDPWRLRTCGFEPFVQTLRAALRRARGVRVDHVMGLFRLWWIPAGADPADGAYVRYPASELLDILALESVRAQAYVVGEDLGTVEPSVRAELAERGVLSYRLLWFEPAPPGPEWPALSMAAVTTHDLPTVAGLWSGADVAEQQALGLSPDPAEAVATRDRVAGWAGLCPDAEMGEVILGVHRLLASAPSALVVATLDDALGVERRPNLPCTTADVRPNWCLALPASLEEIMADPVVAEIGGALQDGT